SRGQGATGQNVTIIGTGFVSGASATFSGTNITVNSTSFVDSTHLTANLTIGGTATTGLRDVTVTNPDAGIGTGSGVFTVAARSTSTTVSCVPGSLTQGTTTSCTATVTDISGAGATAPDGTVTFSTSGGGTFTSSSCTLASPSSTSKSCSATYNTTAAGSQT